MQTYDSLIPTLFFDMLYNEKCKSLRIAYFENIEGLYRNI